jgi:hypothetical protein
MDTVPGEGDVAKMGLLNRQPWINFLALLPGTTLTVLTIAVAFLRFYDEQDFSFLGYVTQPRLWSNRFTVAAVVVAMVNFGVEWDRRNRETYRLAAEAQRRAEEEQRRVEEEQRRVEEEQRSAAERERAARRARIEARCRAAQIRFQLAPSDEHRQMLTAVLAILEEYGETL